MLGMNLSHRRPPDHGSPVNFSGKLYNVIPYGVREDTETIDYDQVRDLALKHRPKLIVVGASAYPARSTSRRSAGSPTRRAAW